MRFRPGLAPTVAAALAVGVLCRLGLWQLERLEQKQQLLAAWQAQVDLPPVPVAQALADPEAFRHRRATASGRYDRERSIVVLRVRRELADGARVLTPLRLAPGPDAPALLVDRGWVPEGARERFLASDRRVADARTVEVTGLVFPLAVGRTPPGSATEVRREWFRFDPGREAQVAALQAQLPYPLLPLLLQRGEGVADELPLGGFEPPRSRVDHRSYAITWFGMAVAALAVWIGLGLQQGRDSARRDASDA